MTIEQAIEILINESCRIESEAKNLAFKIVTSPSAATEQNKRIVQELKLQSTCFAKAAEKIAS